MAKPLISVLSIIALVVLTMTCLATDKDQKPKPAQTVNELQQQVEKILKDKTKATGETI